MMGRLTVFSGPFLALVMMTPSVAADEDHSSDGALVERGRYVVETAGCNDCHTAGYAGSGGDVPEDEWLTGSGLGWHGPWGTTYAINLRIYMKRLSESQWLAAARQLRTRPPMPWFGVRAMTDRDLRAIYQYVRQLGPVGNPVPDYVPAGEKPSGPLVSFPLEPL